jgi:hypothetical protein
MTKAYLGNWLDDANHLAFHRRRLALEPDDGRFRLRQSALQPAAE